MADQGTGIDYRRICVTCNRVVAAIREAHALPPIQPPIQSQRSVPQARRKTHDNILMAIPVMQAALQKYGVIQKARHVDLQRDIGLQEQISNLSQKTKNVAEKAQTLEQVVATLEVRQHQTQAPVSAPQAALAKENIDEQMSEVKVLADGIVHKFQDKAEALEQIVTRLEEHQRRAVATPINAVMFEQKIHDKMSAVKLLAEGLVENLNILEQKEGRVAPVQRGLEYPLASAELETQHQHMTLEAQQWKAKHEDQICQMQDLMLRYEELARAHDSQAARARELEVGHKTLQEQVERLTQQNVAHQESIQTLAPAADDAKCRELELHEVVLQAKGEAQQWQDLHQRAQAQYESAMLELQQSQLAGQQAVQEANMHRQELLSKQAELVQMNALNTKVRELENLVAKKQQEVDSLSQQLRETKSGQAAPTQEEVGEGATFGSLMDEIAALSAKVSQNLKDGPPKSLRSGSPPKSLRTGSPAKEQVPGKETASPTHFPDLAVSLSRAIKASSPLRERGNSASPLRDNSLTAAVAAREAGPSSLEANSSRLFPISAIGATPSPSKVLYTPAGFSGGNRASAPPQLAYPTVATSQAAPAYTYRSVSAPKAKSASFPMPRTMSGEGKSASIISISRTVSGEAGAATETSKGYRTLALRTVAAASPATTVSAI